jgi:hypothetical protein
LIRDTTTASNTTVTTMNFIDISNSDKIHGCENGIRSSSGICYNFGISFINIDGIDCDSGRAAVVIVAIGSGCESNSEL